MVIEEVSLSNKLVSDAQDSGSVIGETQLDTVLEDTRRVSKQENIN